VASREHGGLLLETFQRYDLFRVVMFRSCYVALYTYMFWILWSIRPIFILVSSVQHFFDKCLALKSCMVPFFSVRSPFLVEIQDTPLCLNGPRFTRLQGPCLGRSVSWGTVFFNPFETPCSPQLLIAFPIASRLWSDSFGPPHWIRKKHAKACEAQMGL